MHGVKRGKTTRTGNADGVRYLSLLDIARFYHPSLTTIRQPVEKMAYATIRLLFDEIKKKSGHQQLVFPAELVVGESTRQLDGK